MDKATTPTNNLRSPGANNRPSRVVYIGLVGSAVWLIVGILIGFSALASFSGYSASSILVSDIVFHPDIMIFGVLAGLLITEKLEHMENFRIFKLLRISRPIIFSLNTGVMLVAIGYIYENRSFVNTGLVLIIIASLLFFYYLTSKKGHSVKSIRWIFGASVFSISLSAFANMTSPIWMNVELTYLSLLFPIVYIMAERIELGFIRGMNKQMIAFQAVLSWFVVILGFAAVEYHNYLFREISMSISVFFLVVLVAIAVGFDPSFRASMRKGKFQNYMRSGVIIAYLWLFVGITLFIIQMTTSKDILDAATHSIALGFIGTFIIAHSPIIFPMTLKKNAVQDNVTYLPLIVMTIANVMRVTGDLGPNSSEFWSTVSYLSGYVLIIAIIALVYNLMRITRNSPVLSSVSKGELV